MRGSLVKSFVQKFFDQNVLGKLISLKKIFNIIIFSKN